MGEIGFCFRRAGAELSAVALALCLGAPAFAEGTDAAEGLTADWLPTAAGTYDWWDAANWSGGAAPTNRDDVARFDATAIDGAQTIAMPGIYCTSIAFGVVSGHENQTIRSFERRYNGTSTRNMTVVNPNGFKGVWDQADSRANWIAEPSEDFVPVFQNVLGTYMPQFTVASNRAEIGRVVGGDGLMKRGDGVLAVRGIDPVERPSIRIQATAGTLELALEDEIPDAVVPGAYLHLDAARADTLVVQAGDDGRTYVSEWRDCDGAGISATKHKDVSLPFLSSVTVVRGVPLVDFGANKSSSNTNLEYWTELVGPVATMDFPRTDKVREVFIVFEDTQSSNSCCFVVGDTSSYDFHRSIDGSKLLDQWFASKALRDGVTIVDGSSVAYTHAQDYTKLTVASVASMTEDLRLSTLCNDRYLRYGGARIAELLVYTNNLTQAERERNQFVLRRKWTPIKLPSDDLRELRLAGGTTVDVAEGSPVTVDMLTVEQSGAAVRKTGAGRLRVHSLPRDGFSLEVAGGGVDFVPPDVPVTDDAPASNPQIWFDASCAESLVATNAAGGADGVSICRWNDRRPEQAEIFAATREDDVTFPTLVPDAANGLSVLDFGDGWLKEWGDWGVASGTAARFDISKHTTAYDGFVVIRPKLADGYSTTDRSVHNPPFFGTKSQAFTRWGNGFVVAGYADASVISALWEFDGVPQEAYQTKPAVSTNEFTVVSFSSAEPCWAGDYVANDRNIVCGGVQIGELILYNRRLSSGERKSTQAYLMKKWKGKGHPAMAETIELRSLAYAEGVEPRIETDRRVVVSTLDASGPLKVTGGGSVVVRNLGETIASLTVDGGSFTVADESGAFADAVFHFDASAPRTLEFTVEERDGETVTNVAKWLDVRGNGVYAKASRQKPVAVADPTLRTVETRGGRMMPVMDFGDVNVSGMECDCQTSAGMEIVRSGWDGLVQEAHVVYSDAYDSYSGWAHRFIFSDSQTYACHRNGSTGAMFCSYNQAPWADYVKQGYVGLDGADSSWSYCLTDRRFHVISLAPSNPIYMRTIALDRNCRAGGSRQGELIAFSKALTPARRKYVQDYLLWKWFGEGEKPTLAFSLPAVSLTGGAGAAFPDDWRLQTQALSGTGTLAAGGVSGVASLEPGDSADAPGALAVSGDVALGAGADLVFDFKSPAEYDSLAVSGALAATADTTLTVNVGKGADGVSGDFPILTAASFAGPSPLEWTRVVDNRSNRSVSLVMKDGALCLRLMPSGTVILLR